MLWSLEFFLNVFISVTFISIFICIFFFTYATRIEKQIVVNQTKSLVDDLADDILTFPAVKNNLKPYIQDWKMPDSTSQDQKVLSNNKILLKRAFYMIGICAFITFTIVFGLAYLYKIPMYNLLVPNFIMLCLVALTEFMFLTFIAAKYISFDPNYVHYKIFNTLRKFSDE